MKKPSVPAPTTAGAGLPACGLGVHLELPLHELELLLELLDALLERRLARVL